MTKCMNATCPLKDTCFRFTPKRDKLAEYLPPDMKLFGFGTVNCQYHAPLPNKKPVLTT